MNDTHVTTNAVPYKHSGEAVMTRDQGPQGRIASRLPASEHWQCKRNHSCTSASQLILLLLYIFTFTSTPCHNRHGDGSTPSAGWLTGCCYRFAEGLTGVNLPQYTFPVHQLLANSQGKGGGGGGGGRVAGVTHDRKHYATVTYDLLPNRLR